MVAKGNLSIWIVFPSDFTRNLPVFKKTTMVVYLDSGSLQAGDVVKRPELFMKRQVDLYSQELLIEERPVRAQANIGLALATFLIPLFAVMAPAPFLSESFAGVREKKRLEALLALPMKRFSVLLGKLVSSLIFVAISGVSTIAGVFLYNYVLDIVVRQVGTEGILRFTVDPSVIPLVSVSVILLSISAISIGIVISLLAKDQRTAQHTFRRP